ncbi:MAG: SsrA-binding protein SmpB [Bacteroidota bacterium]|jgi:SsrA-binding protein
MSKNTVNITNRKASHDYHFIQKYTAGIVLSGSEIKSIRAGNVHLTDAYCIIADGEILVKGMFIGAYKEASHFNHEPLRDRKLLLNRQEIRKIKSKSSEKGLTLIPIRLFMSETGYAKLEIAVAQGKKSYDKREDIKKRDVGRDLKRQLEEK